MKRCRNGARAALASAPWGRRACRSVLPSPTQVAHTRRVHSRLAAVYYEETTEESQPWVPVVAWGEECGPRGSTAVTADGATAYCSRLAQTDGAVRSTSPGVAPNTRIVTRYTPPATTERPYPTADESFIETCMGKTGQTQEQCITSIQHGIDNGNIAVP